MSIAFPKPDAAVLARRDEILAGLARLVAPRGADRPRRTSAAPSRPTRLTAYRQMPLAVVLPVDDGGGLRGAALLPRQRRQGRAARGRHLALPAAPSPQEDAIILGVAKMNRVLDIDFENRTARVQAGITNLAISQAVAHEGFFYAPDPSSQLACTIAGNIAMNSGGAHCLKYGVTTNNLLGVTMVLIDGTVVEIGGEHLDSAGYDLLGLVCGSEGQLGVVTEATVRILRAAEGARPALMGFDSAEDGRRLRRGDHRRRHHPGRDGVHGPAGDRDLRSLRPCRLPARRRGDADHRGRGLGRRDRGHARRASSRSPSRSRPKTLQGRAIGGRERRDLEGPQVRLRRHRAASPTTSAWTAPSRPASCRYVLDAHRRDLRTATASASPTCSMPATATCIR